MRRMTESSSSRTEVLYNAACPVCSREIDHYARYTQANELPVRFDDLNDKDLLTTWHMDSETAAKRLHVRKNGEVHAGIPAFLVLWDNMPKYRWLSRLVRLPLIHGAAVWLYDQVLAPLIFRWHLRRMRGQKRG